MKPDLHRLTILAELTILTLVAGAAGAQEVPPYKRPALVPLTGIGFRGDGSGVYPDSKPPTTWDEATGKNILWKVPVPNWCLGCPTPVGNRVLVMSEPSWEPGSPGSVWPELVCYDADTGALVWRQVVDPFLAFPEVTPEQRKQMTEEVAWSQDLYRTAYLATAAIAAKGGAGPDSPEMQKANELLASKGLTVGWVRMNYGQLRKLSLGRNEARAKEIDKRLRPYGVVRYNTWDNNQRCRVGTCFPTPVSDGERVYVITVHGTVACYDMDGKLVWCKASGRWVYGTHGLMVSPRLFGDLLLTEFAGSYDDAKSKADRLIAWDKKTGERRWSVDMPGDAKVKDTPWGSRQGACLTVMHVGKTPVMLSGSGNAVRLPDGKVYDAKIGPTLATWAIDDEHDAIFSDCSYDGPQPRFGLDLAMEGDDLRVKVRWTISSGSQGGPCMVFHQGRLFWSRVQLNPATGLPLGAKDATVRTASAPQTSPRSRHPIFIANGHVYGVVEEEVKKGQTGPVKGICEVFTLEGKKVASNVLQAKERSEQEMNEKWLGQGFEKSSFSYGCPFSIGGDRIYIRSEDYLYCIGDGARLPAPSGIRQ